jgi:hypothetical protein
MNWGVKIFTVYGLFVALMIFMVVNTMKHDVDLVSADYYAKELAFQGQIDKANNFKELNEKVAFKIGDSGVAFFIPGGEELSGVLVFFRPSDPKMDKVFTIVSPEMYIPVSELSSGMYKVKLDWKAGGREYFDEQIIVIP